MYAQLIDDTTGTTLVGVHSKHVAAADAGDRSGKVAQAYAVGQKIAELAQAKQISSVVFDRGGFLFQGRVKAVADGARDGGLQF
jgi:large subunit ribosomal protein L18